MPRGRAFTYDTQRAAILARAAELFAKQGYTATSMNQVARACGVSKPSLYHYVRDKYQLMFEIAQDHVDGLKALVDEVNALDHPDPETRVRLLIERFIGAYADSQAAHRVLTEDVKFLDDNDRERLLAVEREVVAAFADAIAAARPELRAAHMHKPLTMLLFGMMNWMFTWLRTDGRLTHAAMAPVVADLFFGGLAAVRLDAVQPAAVPAPKPPHRSRTAPARAVPAIKRAA